jgi:hypothetical protein
LLDDDTIQTTLDDTMTNMTYVYSGLEQIKNEVIVICHPRTISEADDQTLWELGDAIIRVQTGNTRTIYVKYQDEDGNRIGGRDIQVDDLQFQQGTATATVEDKATSTELIFDNTTGEKDAIVTKCVIKGRKITDFNQMEAKSTDQNSIVDYGRRTLRINLPSIDDLDAAQSIANFERRRRAQPRGDVTAVTLMSHGKNGGGQHAHQLARTLGDRIVIKETQAYHGQGTDYETSAGYFIIGEAHKLSAGATLLETTWYLEPVPTGFPWKLGVTGRSEIGETTTLTY